MRNKPNLIYRIVLAAAAGLVLFVPACGRDDATAPAAGAFSSRPDFGLPTPGQIATGAAQTKSASAAVLLRQGSDFEAGWVQHVTADGTNADYAPNWAGKASAFTEVAYAVYRFNLAGYTGEQSLQLTWSTFPVDLNKVWIGCSDWAGDRWDWHAGPAADGKLTLAAPGFTPYTKPADPGAGDMLVAFVLLGTDPASLAQVRVGPAVIPPTGWTHSWGTAQGEEGAAVEVDTAGNVLIGGYMYSLTKATTDPENAMLFKYNGADGTLMWYKQWGGPYGDVIYDIATDKDNNIYAVGSTYGFNVTPNDAPSLFLLKYGVDGALLWQKTFDAWADAPFVADEGRSIAVDTDGNLYIAGNSDGYDGDGLIHPFFMKLDATGAPVWQKHISAGLGTGSATGCGLAADGTPYFTAVAQNSTVNSWLLGKFGQDGSTTWLRVYGSFTGDTTPVHIAIDSDGSIYTSGYYTSASNALDAILVKFDTAGALAWQKTWGGANDDLAYALALVSGGFIYVAGRTEDSGVGVSQTELRQLDSTGALVGRWLGSATDWNSIYDMAAGAAGELYLSGTAPSANFVLVDAVGVAADLAETAQDAATAPMDVTGFWADVTGTEVTPIGVPDTGGGNDDMLAVKYIVP
jgi:hypothetical protein